MGSEYQPENSNRNKPVQLRQLRKEPGFSRNLFVIGLGQAGLETLGEIHALPGRAQINPQLFYLDSSDAAWQKLNAEQKKGISSLAGRLPDLNDPRSLAPFKNPIDEEWLTTRGADWQGVDPATSRICARMAYFIHFSSIQRTLDQITDAFRLQGGSIYIASDLSEPAGGFLIDLVFTIRHLLNWREIPIQGVFMLDDPHALDEQSCANIYASLLEINAYQKTNAVFRVQYTEWPKSLIQGSGPVFDSVTLFSRSADSGENLSGCAQAARWILLDQMHGDMDGQRPMLRCAGLAQGGRLPSMLGGGENQPSPELKTFVSAARSRPVFSAGADNEQLLQQKWRLFSTGEASELQPVLQHISEIAATIQPAGAPGELDTRQVGIQTEAIETDFSGQSLLTCETFGLPLEHLAWLDSYHSAYKRQIDGGKYLYRLDDEKFGSFRPVNNLVSPQDEPEISALCQVSINGHTLMLVADRYERLRVDARVCPRAQSLDHINGPEGEIWRSLIAAGSESLVQSAAKAGEGFKNPFKLSDIFCSSGGSLPGGERQQSKLIHMITVDDTGYRIMEDHQLMKAIGNVLDICSRDGCSSLAFPQMVAHMEPDRYVRVLYSAITDRFSRGIEQPQIVLVRLSSPEAVVQFTELVSKERRVETFPLDEAILSAYPYPIAKAYRNYLNAREWGEKTKDYAVHLFETTLNFITFLALAECLARPNQDSLASQSFIQSMLTRKDQATGYYKRSIEERWMGPWTGGSLVGILDQCLKWLPENNESWNFPQLAGVKRFLEETNDIDRRPNLNGRVSLLSKMVYERNKIHDNLEVDNLFERTLTILESLRWLTDYDFLACHRSTPSNDGNYKVSFRKLNGADSFFHKLVVTSDVDFSAQVNRPLLLDQKRQQWVFLYPFFLVTDEIETGKPGNAYLHKLKKVGLGENQRINNVYSRSDKVENFEKMEAETPRENDNDELFDVHAYKHLVDLIEKRPEGFQSHGEADVLEISENEE